MPKKAKELTALEVGRLVEPDYYFVGGVAGLILRVLDTGARCWILRASVGGKRRDIGLGGTRRDRRVQERPREQPVRRSKMELTR